MFDALKYHSHEHYVNAIGPYIDVILKKTNNAALLIVGGHADELNDSHFLKIEDGKHLKEVFVKVQCQIDMRCRDEKEKNKHIS